MGGPSTQEEVEPFLSRLFMDRDIIKLGPMQSSLGAFIAKRRSEKVRKQYAEIGGGSPIRYWTEEQGKALCSALDELRSGATHFAYPCFRYAHPLTDEALERMEEDKVDRVVVFPQYPHFSCTTSGSSLNELRRALDRRGGPLSGARWSILDRWPTDPGFIQAVAENVRAGLRGSDSHDALASRESVVLFSAHSLPRYVEERGDAYPREVAATVQAVMDTFELQERPPHVLAWQSKVGFLPWLKPSTEEVIRGLAEKGVKRAVVVPIAFTSDHIETLYEIDIEYKEVADEVGIALARAPSLNDSPTFTTALASLLHNHLDHNPFPTPQYSLKCHGCTNDSCRPTF